MADVKMTDELTAVRDLLREGRTTEADKALDAIQEQIRIEEERRKREEPPPSPKTLVELEGAFQKTVTDLLGNNPRLTALLVEIQAKRPKME